jgi:hypothetical protein
MIIIKYLNFAFFQIIFQNMWNPSLLQFTTAYTRMNSNICYSFRCAYDVFDDSIYFLEVNYDPVNIFSKQYIFCSSVQRRNLQYVYTHVENMYPTWWNRLTVWICYAANHINCILDMKCCCSGGNVYATKYITGTQEQ